MGLLGGDPREIPDPLPAPLARGVELLKNSRRAYEAEIPLDALAAAPFPKLVVSGGHNEAFEAICDVIEAKLGAERAVISGAGHQVQNVGEPFNERIQAFWAAA